MEIKKVTTFLWFNNQAEEAASFYCSIFKNATIITSNPMMATFELEGQRFTAANFGPQFKFNEAISVFVNCETQAEIDYFWNKLSEGGSEGQCGWLKDQFGLSWQIVPSILPKLMSDQAKAERVVQAFMQMKKFDIEKLQQAHDGK